MTNLERFSLGTGIIGLIADVAGLYVFFKSYTNVNEASESSGPLFHLLLLLLYIYGWSAINWVLSRKVVRQKKFTDIGMAMVWLLLGSGIFLLPFVSIWLYLLMANKLFNIFLLDVLIAILAAALLNLIIGAGILFGTGMLMSTLENE